MKKYEEWNANHKHDNPPREKIVKLGRKITDVAGHIFGGVKVEDPEYWGLAERFQKIKKSISKKL